MTIFGGVRSAILSSITLKAPIQRVWGISFVGVSENTENDFAVNFKLYFWTIRYLDIRGGSRKKIGSG